MRSEVTIFKFEVKLIRIKITIMEQKVKTIKMSNLKD